MSLRSLVSPLRVAGLAAVATISISHSAGAQSLIDLLLGNGTPEWSGQPRQVVSFDPQFTPNQIIVSFGDRRLYLITKKGEAISYPIAVPREQDHWQGRTTVSEKKVNPPWRPTPDMLRENPKLPAWVPGGHPMNPLGVRAMYLGASMYRIHGTDAPWTIGQAVSKGCIRMLNEDVLDLYPRVPVGMRVTVTWQQFPTDGSHATANADVPSIDGHPSGQSAKPYSDNVDQIATSNPSERRTIKALAPLPRRDGDDDKSMPDDFIALDADGNAIPKKFVKPKAKADAVSDPAIEPKADKKKDATHTAEHKKPAASKSAEAKAAETTKAPEAKAAEGVKAPDTGSLPDSAKAAPAQLAKAPAAEPAAQTAKANASEPDPAVEAARRAADAAARAAKVAREAAEAAKKAAEDARKATSEDGTSKEPGKDPSKPAKSAAL